MTVMAKNNYWAIEDVNTKFDTLWDAKNHFSFYTPEERDEYDGYGIMHIVNDEAVSACEIRSKNGNVTFGQVRRII